jgi:hypothetical protein
MWKSNFVTLFYDFIEKGERVNVCFRGRIANENLLYIYTNTRNTNQFFQSKPGRFIACVKNPRPLYVYTKSSRIIP